MRSYSTLNKLRAGETFDLEGLLLKMAPGDITPGDLYIAERNGPPKLLTAKEINVQEGWIVPTTFDYSYDTHECVKVEEVLCT